MCDPKESTFRRRDRLWSLVLLVLTSGLDREVFDEPETHPGPRPDTRQGRPRVRAVGPSEEGPKGPTPPVNRGRRTGLRRKREPTGVTRPPPRRTGQNKWWDQSGRRGLGRLGPPKTGLSSPPVTNVFGPPPVTGGCTLSRCRTRCDDVSGTERH